MRCEFLQKENLELLVSRCVSIINQNSSSLFLFFLFFLFLYLRNCGGRLGAFRCGINRELSVLAASMTSGASAAAPGFDANASWIPAPAGRDLERFETSSLLARNALLYSLILFPRDPSALQRLSFGRPCTRLRRYRASSSTVRL